MGMMQKIIKMSEICNFEDIKEPKGILSTMNIEISGVGGLGDLPHLMRRAADAEKKKKPEAKKNPKPEQQPIRIISFPDLMRLDPGHMEKVLMDGGYRVRIHPNQLRELEHELPETAKPVLKWKFIEDPETGQMVDTHA